VTIRIRGVLAAAVLLVASEASAQSARWAGCQPGAPTPSWATRDANGCLQVSAGGTWGNITFRDHTYNWGTAASPRGIKQEQPGWINNGASTNSNCTSGCSNSCNSASWNNVVDNYAPAASGGGRDADILQFNSVSSTKHLFWKNITLSNAWRCDGGTWSGPNGHSCSGQADSNHTDVFQAWRGGPGGGGWWVMQDSTFINSQNELGQMTEPGQNPCGLPGGILWQNVTFGQTSSFAADCRARGGASWACPTGNYFAIWGGPGDWGPVWLVGVNNITSSQSGNPGPTPLQITGSKPVVVIGGSGGGGNWPGPLYSGPGQNCSGSGPCRCQNGLYGTGAEYGSSSSMRIYCYNAIEDALADTTCADCPFTRPPFIALSATGWRNPPTGSGSGGDSQPPSPPQLIE
jgi:hypothetical protein